MRQSCCMEIFHHYVTLYTTFSSIFDDYRSAFGAVVDDMKFCRRFPQYMGNFILFSVVPVALFLKFTCVIDVLDADLTSRRGMLFYNNSILKRTIMKRN